MNKNAILSVRLDSKDFEKLEGISDETGISVSCLIRLLASSFIDSYSRTNGKIELPLRLNRERC